MDEARSENLGKGKWKYQGKTGKWRTLENGDRVFFPDDKSEPLAMRGPKQGPKKKMRSYALKKKKKGLLSRVKSKLKKAVKSLRSKDDFKFRWK